MEAAGDKLRHIKVTDDVPTLDEFMEYVWRSKSEREEALKG